MKYTLFTCLIALIILQSLFLPMIKSNQNNDIFLINYTMIDNGKKFQVNIEFLLSNQTYVRVISKISNFSSISAIVPIDFLQIYPLNYSFNFPKINSSWTMIVNYKHKGPLITYLNSTLLNEGLHFFSNLQFILTNTSFDKLPPAFHKVNRKGEFFFFVLQFLPGNLNVITKDVIAPPPSSGSESIINWQIINNNTNQIDANSYFQLIVYSYPNNFQSTASCWYNSTVFHEIACYDTGNDTGTTNGVYYVEDDGFIGFTIPLGTGTYSVYTNPLALKMYSNGTDYGILEVWVCAANSFYSRGGVSACLNGYNPKIYLYGEFSGYATFATYLNITYP